MKSWAIEKNKPFYVYSMGFQQNFLLPGKQHSECQCGGIPIFSLPVGVTSKLRTKYLAV